MRVATFNLHAGVDGWGRMTAVLDHAVGLRPDVLICPELWRDEGGTDLYRDLAIRLDMRGIFVPLALADRANVVSGGRSWQPLLAHFRGEQGLYFSEHRTLKKSQLERRAAQHHTTHGEWGLGLLTRFTIEDLRVEPLGRLAREKVRRALIVARLREGGRSFYVLALHGAHLSHGSYRQYRRVASIVDALDASLPIILAGDFNSWRPLLRLFLPGWRTLVRARTWPARHPHSQIDHILGRGPWLRHGGGASDGGSDHRALYADITLPR